MAVSLEQVVACSCGGTRKPRLTQAEWTQTAQIFAELAYVLASGEFEASRDSGRMKLHYFCKHGAFNFSVSIPTDGVVPNIIPLGRVTADSAGVSILIGEEPGSVKLTLARGWLANLVLDDASGKFTSRLTHDEAERIRAIFGVLIADSYPKLAESGCEISVYKCLYAVPDRFRIDVSVSQLPVKWLCLSTVELGSVTIADKELIVTILHPRIESEKVRIPRQPKETG